MWFRRKNKTDSDHSVLSSTLVSLQGLLDEKPVAHESKAARHEPRLPAASANPRAGTQGAAPGNPAVTDDLVADDATEPAITEVRNILTAVDQRSTDPNPVTPQASADTKDPGPSDQDAAARSSGGSSWADLDLEFDEVESTVAMPVVTEHVNEATDPDDIEPDEEIEAAPPPDPEADALDDPVNDVTPRQAETMDSQENDGTTTTLFDVIPTLNEVVFEPDDALKATDPPPQPATADQTPPNEVPTDQPPIAEEEPPVIIFGAPSPQTRAPAQSEPPPQAGLEDETSPPPLVPLAPNEFADFVLQRFDNAYHEHLREELPAPLREATKRVLLDSMQQWIAQARQVLQKKQ